MATSRACGVFHVKQSTGHGRRPARLAAWDMFEDLTIPRCPSHRPLARHFPGAARIGYMGRMIRAIALLVAVACAAPVLAQAQSQAQSQPPAQARPRADVAAQQAAGLFVTTCVQHAGQPASLRAWASKLGLPPLPDPGQAGFLKGAPGRVYDASNPAGKYVVISLDDGGCMVLAESVNTVELLRATEGALAQIGISAVLDGDRADLGDSGMRHRTYHASLADRGWTVVISYGPRQPDQAMLSAAAR
jgi:hypothetical protein